MYIDEGSGREEVVGVTMCLVAWRGRLLLVKKERMRLRKSLLVCIAGNLSSKTLMGFSTA
jgi:hypothetical protein